MLCPSARSFIHRRIQAGNEAWGKVAAEVRKEYVAHVNTVRPMIVYSADGCGSRAMAMHAIRDYCGCTGREALEYQDRKREPPQRCTLRGRSCDVPIGPARCVCG